MIAIDFATTGKDLKIPLVKSQSQFENSCVDLIMFQGSELNITQDQVLSLAIYQGNEFYNINESLDKKRNSGINFFYKN